MATSLPIQAEESPMNFATVLPENVDWQLIPDGLGARYAVVFGNPEQAGTYVVRVFFPAGVMD